MEQNEVLVRCRNGKDKMDIPKRAKRKIMFIASNVIFRMEWNREKKDDDRISKLQLFDSLFELVDIWTPDVCKDQYMVFFELLKMKILI